MLQCESLPSSLAATNHLLELYLALLGDFLQVVLVFWGVFSKATVNTSTIVVDVSEVDLETASILSVVHPSRRKGLFCRHHGLLFWVVGFCICSKGHLVVAADRFASEVGLYLTWPGVVI